MNHRGELQVDQAHRGYSTATEDAGYASLNPLFMRYIPLDGKFVGQDCYGYRSIEKFIDAALNIVQGYTTSESFDSTLPTVSQTLQTTAILQAGRLSLDSGNRPAKLHYTNIEPLVPIRIGLE
jgi:D-galacturonate reductase